MIRKVRIKLSLEFLLLMSGASQAGQPLGIYPPQVQDGSFVPKSNLAAGTASKEGLITFDDFQINTSITTQYQSKGVVFDPSFIELDNLPSVLYLSKDNESFPRPYGNGKNAGTIGVTFVKTTSFVQADPVYLDGGSTMTMTVFDGSNTKIGQTTGLTTLKIAVPGIKRAVFSFTKAGAIDDIAGIDNLMFDTGSLSIKRPANSSQSFLSQQEYNSTPPIIFNASSSNKSDNVSWATKSTYTTSGGVGPFSSPTLTFSSVVDGDVSKSIAQQGGRLDVTATQGTSSSSAKMFISGNTTGIPNNVITRRLIDIYTKNHSGITQYTTNLLCHIAVQESAYRQFRRRALYGITAQWPTENFPTTQVRSGQYIGLLQVNNSMLNAFDWKSNTQSGVNILNEKLASVIRYQNAQRLAHRGLPAMTGVQVEDSALVFYGGFGARDPVTCKPLSGAMRFYIPGPAGTAWIVNRAVDCVSTQGNTARQYVSGIRNNVIPQ